MGHGLAQQFAQAGYIVSMYNRSRESSQRAMRNIESSLRLFSENNLIDESEVGKTLSRITPCQDISLAAEGADFVIESVAENLPLKQEIFRSLGEICRDDVVLASDTSSLRITDIAARTRRPERTITAHHYTPPPLIPVVEVAPGERTDEETISRTMELLKDVGKKPVLVKEVPGHIGVRLTTALRREAYSIVEKGIATPEDVDTVLKDVSRLLTQVGILEVSDLSGLDVMLDVQSYLQKEIDAGSDPSRMLREKVRRGELGIKSGRGFFDWSPETIADVKRRRDSALLGLLREDIEKKDRRGG